MVDLVVLEAVYFSSDVVVAVSCFACSLSVGERVFMN